MKLKKIWRNVFRIFLGLFVSSFLYVLVCKWVMPPFTLLQIADGISYGMDKQYVDQSGISKFVPLAAIASEDQRFPDHFGFDFIAIEQSFRNKKGKKNRLPLGAAASTISQQTAKNVFLWQGGGIWRYVRKIPEAYFTLLIECIWGKERILLVYLNVIEMGQGLFGIEAAAQRYFHKHASELTRQEAAMIIAALPNPKKFTVKPISSRVAWRFPQIIREINNIVDDVDIKKLLVGYR